VITLTVPADDLSGEGLTTMVIPEDQVLFRLAPADIDVGVFLRNPQFSCCYKSQGVLIVDPEYIEGSETECLVYMTYPDTLGVNYSLAQFFYELLLVGGAPVELRSFRNNITEIWLDN
jgi:hypothetical protein